MNAGARRPQGLASFPVRIFRLLGHRPMDRLAHVLWQQDDQSAQSRLINKPLGKLDQSLEQ